MLRVTRRFPKNPKPRNKQPRRRHRTVMPQLAGNDFGGDRRNAGNQTAAGPLPSGAGADPIAAPEPAASSRLHEHAG